MQPTHFVPGQCWMSEAEPELGLGFIVEVSPQTVIVGFPQSEQERRYGRKSAPLKRVTWHIGDRVQSRDGASLVVERIEEREGLLWYVGDETELCEMELSAKTKLMGPVGRLASGQWDSPIGFELRRRTLEYWSQALSSPVRGLLGPRVELIPHQVYVVSEVAGRSLPRVLLADEVGLGKTIEAGWIAHQLLVSGRMSRVLVVAPRAMLNQWFVEMRRRFNLTFRVPEAEAATDGATVQVAAHELLIMSLESLKHDSVRQVLEGSSWDLIIVDEAHRVQWSVEGESVEYTLLKKISSGSRGLLLLTATPEQLGIEGHFGRLHLLDPQRFSSYEDYLGEHDRYTKVAKKAEAIASDKSKEEELRMLIDEFGTGRVYFRNARKVVEAESYRFPKRDVRPHELKTDAHRWVWLKELFTQYSDDKFLLICSTRTQVEEIEAELKQITRVNTALFHEGQSLIVRDRAAAYFADEAGARILLSSEIGSEGRNFQFARHLILWDLPEDPDVLEQRIGRLDRIGQGKEFKVHVPYVRGSQEELLYRWYHEVFDVFRHPATGAADVHFMYWPFEASALEKTIKKAKADYAKKREALEQGRDRLIELNSFNARAALKGVKILKSSERSEELQEYMESVFSWVGVNEEDLDEESFFVEPGDSMFIPSFPGLPDEGLRVTFNRRKALEREDLTLLSWDHPMVRQIMETIMGQEFGSVTLARWREPRPHLPQLLECYFVLQQAAEPKWYGDEFLPPLPIRVVLDMRGQVVSEAWPAEKIAKEVSRLKTRPEDWLRLPLRNAVRELSDRALAVAQKQSVSARGEAMKRMHERIESEVGRLEALADKNGLVSPQEIAWWLMRADSLAAAYKSADLRLDSIRIVF